MPDYQTEVAVALTASAVCSSLVYYFKTRNKEGRIKLPTQTDELGERLHDGIDPFDITKAEDFIDGYEIEGVAFWDKMRWRKLLISLLLATISVADTIPLVWSLVVDEPKATIVHAFSLAFSIYVFVLTLRAVNQNIASEHSNFVLHLTTLTTIAVTLLGVIAILPATSPTAPVEINPILRAIRNVKLSLYTIVCLAAFVMPRGPPLHFPPEMIYSEKTVLESTNTEEENVCGVSAASPWDALLFSYSTKVVWLSNVVRSFEPGDLPIIPAYLRATVNYAKMRKGLQEIHLQLGSWRPKPGSGWSLGYQLLRLNSGDLLAVLVLGSTSAVLVYTPALVLQRFIAYLEVDESREDTAWGWFYVIALFAVNVVNFIVTAQLWSLSTTIVQLRLKTQLNSILFAKTLVRKDVASSAPSSVDAGEGGPVQPITEDDAETLGEKPEDEFSSKAQIMTLMTTDVDRVSALATRSFLVAAPVEIAFATYLLYHLLGVSCFVGLAAVCLFIPLNHIAGKIIIGAQEKLMKARDERVSLMNEILGGIRMLKFMAWERKYEAKVLGVRDKELKTQRLNYIVETLWGAIWGGAPILVTLVSFWHFTMVRRQILSPSIAFTSVSDFIFSEIRYPLTFFPEVLTKSLQTFVSLKRIETYLQGEEVLHVPPSDHQSQNIAFQSCTVTWSRTKPSRSGSSPRSRFILADLTLNFPLGELSLICGKLGSGKTLLLLGTFLIITLLGEADTLSGQILCPRSPPDTLASFSGTQITEENWIVQGICAYVPQTAWLRNASLKDNIVFSLPFDKKRYQRTLEVCALTSDLEILEDGDESEIGERGVNLSGGQKARVSLARAVYSRASILLLDDVLSAVDAHTADYLYHECLKGELMCGRTVILVSHHVQLCTPGASYVVALDNGRLQFQGDRELFQSSSVMRNLVHSTDLTGGGEDTVTGPGGVTRVKELNLDITSTSGTVTPEPSLIKSEKREPRKLIEEEKRAVGLISRDVWRTYFKACGNGWYWSLFLLVVFVASLSPVLENGWIRYWASRAEENDTKGPSFYIAVYAAVTAVGLIIGTIRFFVLFKGSIRASRILYKKMLKAILFANMRFHDTVSRGRVLNRFGKDFEGIDSTLADDFIQTTIHAVASMVTIVTLTIVGGYRSGIAVGLLLAGYYKTAKVYSQASRDMRRLDSVTRSPLYTIYDETISGVTVLRAFGASTKFLRDMLCCVDTNSIPFYWMWGANRWVSIRFNLFSACISGVTALMILVTPSINASLAGFALTFAYTITIDIVFVVRRFVNLEQSMVALERVKEYTDISQEPPEFMEPRPPASWPSSGAIVCKDLVVRYDHDLPDILHGLNFEVLPGEKIGILGRTGSGKSTLAMSFFRFVEAAAGQIIIDGIDISGIGLTDLRRRLTIIPQDPTILSGSLRSTLNIFDEFGDADIFEALRRVHLIPSERTNEDVTDAVNANVFRSLDFSVSEGGENFSAGEKQLLCMARAILKRSKVLVMDENSSVDYATDEFIGKTIREEFAESTILTIAHRLRTIIDYDKVMVLDNGLIAEYDRPSVLLCNTSSMFYALCKAAGKEEFATLKKMAGV
ncbi:multidrug resistance-associated ABC transporter [Collybia nuda]|uniref:Multidrug resistance-associated ABC transporter n=1 Tax=Collybia nuda TaxID=64659 RepID=A0A9P5XYN2_9AGAR|nr:multidrug resistance-associated ABC transporter [Collybia nuda]